MNELNATLITGFFTGTNNGTFGQVGIGFGRIGAITGARHIGDMNQQVLTGQLGRGGGTHDMTALTDMKGNATPIHGRDGRGIGQQRAALRLGDTGKIAITQDTSRRFNGGIGTGSTITGATGHGLALGNVGIQTGFTAPTSHGTIARHFRILTRLVAATINTRTSNQPIAPTGMVQQTDQRVGYGIVLNATGHGFWIQGHFGFVRISDHAFGLHNNHNNIDDKMKQNE